MIKKSDLLKKAIENLSKTKNENIDILDVLSYLEDLQQEEQIKENEKAVKVKRKPFKIPRLATTENCKLVQTGVKQKILNTKDFRVNLDTEIDLRTWLENLRDTAYFLDRESIPKFIEWAYKFTRDIQKSCENGDVDTSNQNGLHLLINSVVQGSGKSTFISNLVDGAKDLGIAATESRLPAGSFYNNTAEATNLVVGYEESHRDNFDKDVLYHIGRREPYMYNQKGREPIQLQSRALTIGSTNNEPYSMGRPLVTVHCLPASLQEYQEYFKNFTDKVNQHNTIIYRLQKSSFLDSYFLSYLFKKNNNDNIKNKNKISDSRPRNQETKALLAFGDGIYLLLDVINAIVDPVILSNCSVATLDKCYKRSQGTSLTFNQKKLIAETLFNMYSKSIIKKLSSDSNDFYKRFDLYDLYGIRSEDLVEAEEGKTIQKEIEETYDMWNSYIEDLCNHFSNLKKETFLKETDKVLPNNSGWSFGERYDKEFSEVNTGQSLVCVNKSKIGKAARTNDSVESYNYLCECDDIDKEQQKAYIEKLPSEVKKAILWVCDSGGKSIHVVIKTSLSCNTKERGYILKKLSDAYFGGHLDMSAKNPGRLCRNPNAIRDNGNRQQCLYMNLDAVPLNILRWKVEINQMLKEEEIERQKKIVRRDPNQPTPTIHTLQQLKDWNDARPTKCKAECIAFLEGTLQDWNRGIACVRALRIYGFDDFDIEKEAWSPDDKWIKAAIKGAK